MKKLELKHIPNCIFERDKIINTVFMYEMKGNMIIEFFFSFLLHPRNYYNVSLHVTFSNTFDIHVKVSKSICLVAYFINYSL